MIDHAVDRSLCSTLVRNVSSGWFYQFAVVNLVGDLAGQSAVWGSHT